MAFALRRGGIQLASCNDICDWCVTNNEGACNKTGIDLAYHEYHSQIGEKKAAQWVIWNAKARKKLDRRKAAVKRAGIIPPNKQELEAFVQTQKQARLRDNGRPIIDPLTIAVAAFSAIKSGVSAGREIQDLMGEVGKLWAASDQINSNYTTAKSKSSLFGSAEEEAMSEFIAKTKAREMEDELRELQYTRGADAWNELIRMRGEARKRRKEEAADIIRKKRERIDLFIQIGVGIAASLIGIMVIVAFFAAIIR